MSEMETLVSAAREHASRLLWLGYPEQIEQAEAIERAAVKVPAANRGAVSVLEWLVALDDPSEEARELRRRVTLGDIVDRARAVLEGQ